MDKLQQFLSSKNFPVDLPLDNEIHRFDREGELSGWLVGYEINVGGKRVAHVKCGDWRGGEQYEFSDQDDVTFTESELAEFKLEKRKRDKATQEAKKRAEEATSKICEEILAASHGVNGFTSPYLEKKKLGGLFGARLIRTEEYRDLFESLLQRKSTIPSGYVNLLVPARDADGKLWSLQSIRPDGGKSFFPGSRVNGVFHLLGEIPGADAAGGDRPLVYVAEGFATAGSIHMATGRPVVCAFHAGNLLDVGRALAQAHPHLQLVFCGDDDRFSFRRDGTPLNAGREKATRAAHELSVRVVFPHFSNDDGKPTDFNDLHCREGLERVREQLENPPQVEETSGLVALPGKMNAAKHQPVVNALLRYYGDKLIKQDRDLFLYTGTHWKYCDTAEHDHIMRQLQVLCGGQATAEHLASMKRLLITFCEAVPEGVDLFTPPQWAVNFQNGTLFVDRHPRGRKSIAFRAHSRLHWMTNVLPYDYREGDTTRNPEFDAMLERVFEGDHDKEGKIRALRQMYGACLIPAYPHLFMLYGPPGTGKSTAIILASRLVHKDNACSVDPTEFEGFNLESMAGKLINFDTDIEMNKPITDKQVKKIIDRLPFRIRRKNIRDLYAPIPAVHIFGGNGIPKTLDGASRAHDRRWTFIEFRVVVAKGSYDLDYADYCFQASPQGILNFALEGLRDLIACGGHFYMPESGAEKMREWLDQADPVSAFLSEVRAGELRDGNAPLSMGPEAQMQRSTLWGIFKEWLKESSTRSTPMSRTAFYTALRRAGLRDKTIRGVDYFEGIGVGVGGKADH